MPSRIPSTRNWQTQEDPSCKLNFCWDNSDEHTERVWETTCQLNNITFSCRCTLLVQSFHSCPEQWKQFLIDFCLNWFLNNIVGVLYDPTVPLSMACPLQLIVLPPAPLLDQFFCTCFFFFCQVLSWSMKWKRLALGMLEFTTAGWSKQETV